MVLVDKRRTLLHVFGLALFLAILAYAIHKSPPQLGELYFGWFLVAVLAVLLVLCLQIIQTTIFIRVENLQTPWIWAAWFTAEKAWLNNLVPAKAGTASAIALLQLKFGVRWDRYLRFMLYAATLTASASISGVILLARFDWISVVAAIFLYSFVSVLNLQLYRLPFRMMFLMSLLGIVQLVILTLGLGACLIGLGYLTEWRDVFFAGISLNLLSIVSITPGNFGIRELVLAWVSQLTQASFSEVIQASTCFVFIRLIASVILAGALRPFALQVKGGDSKVKVD